MNKNRVTIYITDEMLDWSNRLRLAFHEENQFVPEMSRNKWISLLLEVGAGHLQSQLQEVE